MISFNDALSRVLGSVSDPIESDSVPIESAHGRYLTQAISAPIDVPGFANSAMDGYAVKVADINIGERVSVSGRVAAGEDPGPLSPGSVVRIFTGAKIPVGADAVILQEDARIQDDGCVEFIEMPGPGQHIRPAGQDIQRDSLLLDAGRRLSAADIGLVASVGIAEMKCARPLRVAFFSTGDELQLPGKPLSGAQIYNSNRYVLAACLRELGMQPVDLGVCEDSAEATRDILLRASEQADCIITTGGMSVGDEDYVRSQAQALGELDFWKIAMKPGKPFAMGSIQGVPFFGLPGNPVSTFVTFQLLVKPWLLKKTGANFQQRFVRARAQFDFENRGKRLDFLRGKLITNEASELTVSLFENQSSGVLSSIAQSNALIPVEPGCGVNRGELVEVIFLLNGDIVC